MSGVYGGDYEDRNDIAQPRAPQYPRALWMATGHAPADIFVADFSSFGRMLLRGVFALLTIAAFYLTVWTVLFYVTAPFVR